MADKILVTDAELRKSVPIVRSLGRAGLYVVCGSSTRWAPSFFSKYCREAHIYPDPKDERLFLEWLISNAERKLFNIVFPICDSTMAPITKHLDLLQKYMKIPVVDFSTYMLARDKYQTIQQAEQSGVPVPKTWGFSSPEEYRARKHEISLPVVIKPRSSSGSRGVRYVQQIQDLDDHYYQIHRNYGLPLIQEYIPPGGDALGVGLLCNHGQVLATFMYKRLREYPLSGGPSTLRESIYDENVMKLAIKLMTHMKWHGIAMVEFKVDPRDGTAKLLEVNPRFWGSIALPVVCGVDFPLLLYELARGTPKSVNTDYNLHVRCRWLPGDICHFLVNPHRFHLKPSFFDLRNEHDDLFVRNDIGPIFGTFIALSIHMFQTERWKRYFFRSA